MCFSFEVEVAGYTVVAQLSLWVELHFDVGVWFGFCLIVGETLFFAQLCCFSYL
jgi:hypothetical protein